MSINLSIIDIEKKRELIQKKLFFIKKHLHYNYSEPLKDYYIDLLKKDMYLCCKLTDYLI